MGRRLPSFLLAGLLAACGTGGGTETPSPASPTPTPSGSPSESPTPTAAPNTAPTATMGAVVVSNGYVSVPIDVFDAEGDLIDLTLLYSVDGSIYQAAERRSGSDDTRQVSSGTTVNYVWDVLSDVFPGDASITAEEQQTHLTLRVIPYDGSLFGADSASASFTFPADEDLAEEEVIVGEDTPIPEDPTPPDISVEGGYEDPEFSENRAQIELNPDGERDNREEEFLLVLVNVGSDAIYYIGDDSELPNITPTPTSTPDATPTFDETPTPVAARLAPRPLSPEWSAAHTRYQKAHPAVPSTWARQGVSAEPGKETVDEFRVLSNVTTERYKTILAVLAAKGDSVEIWVDQDIPIDWDFDCNGVIEESEGDEYDQFGRDSYGFDSCDLEAVGQTFSDNILTNLNNVFGYESDVDENGAVTVLITPVLNTLNLTNIDPSDDGQIVEVLAYPEVDLAEYSPTDNAGSNYKEIFYLPAPDPAGFFNPKAGGGGEEAIQAYLTFTMAANLARATQSLISYNNHVLINGGSKEEAWLDRAFSTLAADVAGFGGQTYAPLFDYLAATQLGSLTGVESDDFVAAEPYLLVRYLADRFGPEFIGYLLDSKTVGLSNIASTLEGISDGTQSFEEVLLDFATNLYLQDKYGPDGEPLLDPDITPGFAGATTIPLSGTTPFPGAEGYQQGVNVFGENVFRTRSGDDLVTEGRWVLRGADWANYAPGTRYAAFIAGGIGIHAVRMGGLIQKSTGLAVASTGDLLVRIVRLPDRPDGVRSFITEQVYGALSTQTMALPLRGDGWGSVALGEIDEDESLVTLDTGETIAVADTDLYRLDLRGEEEGVLSLEIFATRKVGASGEPELEKIFVAVAPLGDVPNAEQIDGVLCGEGGQSVDYPRSYPEYLAYQTVLSSTLVGSGRADQARAPAVEGCDTDGDGIPDDAEARPESLVDQITTWQAQAGGGSSTVQLGAFYPYDEAYDRFVNIDAIDDDDVPYADPLTGINTRNAEEGEEGYLRVELPAGGESHQYVVIVGGPDSAGPYDLTVRRLSEDEL